MKKFLVILFALVATEASGYYVYQTSVQILTTFVEQREVMVSNDDHSLSSVFSSESGDSFWDADEMGITERELVPSTAPTSSSSSAAASSSSSAADVAYAQYVDGVIGNGQTSLLFFYDATEFSRNIEREIKAVYRDGNAGINTYRVDFQNFDELRKRYGAKKEGTLVLVDGTGKRIRIVETPTTTDVQSLLVSLGHDAPAADRITTAQ